MLDDFATEKGIDKGTKAWDAGDAAAEVASWFALAGALRSLAKHLLKGMAKNGAEGADDVADKFPPKPS